MRIYILNATLTFTSSIGIASANLVHFCTKSILRLEDIINGKLKNNKIKKHTIATSFELLLLDRNYCSPISFCSKSTNVS